MSVISTLIEPHPRGRRVFFDCRGDIAPDPADQRRIAVAIGRSFALPRADDEHPTDSLLIWRRRFQGCERTPHGREVHALDRIRK